MSPGHLDAKRRFVAKCEASAQISEVLSVRGQGAWASITLLGDPVGYAADLCARVGAARTETKTGVTKILPAHMKIAAVDTGLAVDPHTGAVLSPETIRASLVARYGAAARAAVLHREGATPSFVVVLEPEDQRFRAREAFDPRWRPASCAIEVDGGASGQGSDGRGHAPRGERGGTRKPDLSVVAVTLPIVYADSASPSRSASDDHRSVAAAHGEERDGRDAQHSASAVVGTPTWTREQKLTQGEMSLPEWAKQLGHVSQACTMASHSRDRVPRCRKWDDPGGGVTRQELSRRELPLATRTPPGAVVMIMNTALNRTDYEQIRGMREVRTPGHSLSPVGMRGGWQRYDSETTKRQLKAVQAKVEEDFVLTESQLAPWQGAKAETDTELVTTACTRSLSRPTKPPHCAVAGTRRSWTREAMRAILAEAESTTASVSSVARRHDPPASLLVRWLRETWDEERAGVQSAQPAFAPPASPGRPIGPDGEARSRAGPLRGGASRARCFLLPALRDHGAGPRAPLRHRPLPCRPRVAGPHRASVRRIPAPVSPGRDQRLGGHRVADPAPVRVSECDGRCTGTADRPVPGGGDRRFRRPAWRQYDAADPGARVRQDEDWRAFGAMCGTSVLTVRRVRRRLRFPPRRTARASPLTHGALRRVASGCPGWL
jgi:transposase-like protein